MVGRQGDPSDLYTIADLSMVWVELAVPTADLEMIEEGQAAVIASGSESRKRGDGRIMLDDLATPLENLRPRLQTGCHAVEHRLVLQTRDPAQIKPPITTVARGFCTSAPVPVANRSNRGIG
jgi:hypothetical protein